MPVAPSPRQQLLIGLAAPVAGLSIVAMATGIFAAPEQSFRASHWVLAVAELVFALTGAMFLAPLLLGGFAAADQHTERGKKPSGRLKEIPGLAKLRLIALTGYGQESDRQESLVASFQHHLVKPIGMEALQQAIGARSR
jgi:hypothetical protein